MLRSLLAAALLLAPPTPARKTYADRADGVEFSYPASWLLNADDDAATAKLRIADLGQLHAAVQLEGAFTGEGPYKDTDFDAGAFAYTVLSDQTEQECFAALDRIAGQPAAPATTASGLRGQRVEFRAAVAGTEDLHAALASFHAGRCFLFETVIVRRSPDAVARPLDSAHWKRLTAEFNRVLDSVRVRPDRPTE